MSECKTLTVTQKDGWPPPKCDLCKVEIEDHFVREGDALFCSQGCANAAGYGWSTEVPTDE